MKKTIIFTILFLLSSVGCFATEELSQQAVALYSDNNYTKTMDLLLQIEEKDRSAQDWLLLGNLLSENAQKEEAIYMYQKAISTDKKFYKSYYNIANIYMNDGKYAAAIDYYKMAVRYNKKNAYLYYNLGCAYLKLGQTQKAKSAILSALELKNDVPEFQYNMSYIYKQLNKPKLSQTYLDNYNKLVNKEELESL